MTGLQAEPLYVCEEVAKQITSPLEVNKLTVKEIQEVDTYLENIAIANESLLLIGADYFWMSDNGICEITGELGVVFGVDIDLVQSGRF